MTHNETYQFRTPKQFASLHLRLTQEMMAWIAESTEDNKGRKISNGVLFIDLLARLRTNAHTDISFRRPKRLPAGWFQFSELRLSEEWRMGRKRIHNLLLRLDAMKAIYAVFNPTHSTMTFPCVVGWTTHDGQSATLIGDGQYIEDGAP